MQNAGTQGYGVQDAGVQGYRGAEYKVQITGPQDFGWSGAGCRCRVQLQGAATGCRLSAALPGHIQNQQTRAAGEGRLLDPVEGPDGS